MTDMEQHIDETPVDVEEEEDDTPADLNAALQQVLKRARAHKGLTRGLRETVKALDKRIAHLCVLAEDCNEGGYTALIEALCTEHGIDLIKIPEKKKLGEWVGLVQYDQAANIKKVIGTSSVAVTDFGEKSRA